MAEYPLFEARLRQIIGAFKAMDSLDIIIRWKDFLDSHDLDDLCTKISHIALPRTKELLNRQHAPSLAEVESLRRVLDSEKPGVYLGIINNLADESMPVHSYVGSATNVSGGLKFRINQHQDPLIRKTYLETHPNCFHYKLLEDGTRTETFYVLAEATYTSVIAADIYNIRLLVVLAESIFMSWLRSFSTQQADGSQKAFALLCPYFNQHLEWAGTNFKSPLKDDPRIMTRDALGLTAKEQNLRKAAQNKKRRESYSPEESAKKKAEHAEYQQRIGIPVKTFKRRAKNAGMAAETYNAMAKTFMDDARLAKKHGNPTPQPEAYLKIA